MLETSQTERGSGVRVHTSTVVTRFLAWVMSAFAFMAVLLTPVQARAQIQTVPQWAVIEFKVKGGQGEGLGRQAAEAMANGLGGNEAFEILPIDTASRQAGDLGLVEPVTESKNLIRLGQALEVERIIHGEVIDAVVRDVAGGKQGFVGLRVMVTNVASGRVVNGAAIVGKSDVRSGDVSNEQLIREAFNDAAFLASSQVLGRNVAQATILSILDDKVLMNRGATSGYGNGQRVVITRRGQFVAEATVTQLSPDDAYLRVQGMDSIGIRPGDKVEPLFEVPNIVAVGPQGEAQVRGGRRSSDNSGIVATLILLVVVGFLVGGGKGGNNVGAGGVTAEAMIVSPNNPGIRVSWRRDSFFRGQQSVQLWQVYKLGVQTPVAVVPGDRGFAYDDTLQSDGPSTGNQYAVFTNGPGGATCANASIPFVTPVPAPPLALGVAFTYSVEAVYRVSGLDLPGDGGGTTGGGGTGGLSGGGTTGGGTTGGGTTGGTTGGGTTGGLSTGGTTGGGTTGGGTTGGTTGGSSSGNEFCYFVTSRSSASGVATAFAPTTLVSPADGEVVATPRSFSFQSVRGADATAQIEYVLQISNDPRFPRNNSRIVSTQLDRETTTGATISTQSINFSSFFPNSATIYWRVGVRNIADNPGPAPDPATGERYIFSGVRAFSRPLLPGG